ncbi:hypothetical protein [Rhodococcus sp. X156]|uniref:hypothetical protein n=1 Tax=Rhodococcus sp. X156 TaxID=2499145 RepID=UPI0013E3D665|nr:hypothetical protein [Rhodococcus sp. X156]
MIVLLQRGVTAAHSRALRWRQSGDARTHPLQRLIQLLRDVLVTVHTSLCAAGT